MNTRHIQVAEEIQHIVSYLIQRELKDPRLGFVTVTRVEVSRDLKYARVFVSVMGTPEEQKAQHGCAGIVRVDLCGMKLPHA